MEIMISDKVLDTVCNALTASKQSLKKQLLKADTETKREVLKHQLTDVDEALRIFTRQ
jgi:predicted nucleic acid-binding protein